MLCFDLQTTLKHFKPNEAYPRILCTTTQNNYIDVTAQQKITVHHPRNKKPEQQQYCIVATYRSTIYQYIVKSNEYQQILNCKGRTDNTITKLGFSFYGCIYLLALNIQQKQVEKNFFFKKQLCNNQDLTVHYQTIIEPESAQWQTMSIELFLIKEPKRIYTVEAYGRREMLHNSLLYSI